MVSVLYTAVYAFMSFSYFSYNSECTGTTLHQESNQLIQFSYIVFGLHCLCFVLVTIVLAIQQCIRTSKRKSAGSYESSDEEDDRKFDQMAMANDLGRRQDLQERIEANFEPLRMARMRELMGAERQSQQIVDRMQQIEN